MTNTVGVGVQTDSFEALLGRLLALSLSLHGGWGQDQITVQGIRRKGEQQVRRQRENRRDRKIQRSAFVFCFLNL